MSCILIQRWTVYYYWIIKIQCCKCNKASYNIISFLAFQHYSTTTLKHTHRSTFFLINLTQKVSDMSSPPVLSYRGRWREGPILSRTHLSTLWITVAKTVLFSARDWNRLRSKTARELFWSWMLLTVVRVMATCWQCSAWKDGRLLGHGQKTYTRRKACAVQTTSLVSYLLFSNFINWLLTIFYVF